MQLTKARDAGADHCGAKLQWRLERARCPFECSDFVHRPISLVAIAPAIWDFDPTRSPS